MTPENPQTRSPVLPDIAPDGATGRHRPPRIPGAQRVLRAFLTTASIFFWLLVASAASAQDFDVDNDVSGVARDASGAVLPGVTVEAAGPALVGPGRTVVTDARGQYRFVDLPPGVYSLTFSLPGFVTFKRNDVVVTANSTWTINTVMNPAPPLSQPPPPTPPAAQPWRISGLIFGDYYYFGSTHLETADPSWKDQQGFWIRRAYFTYDYDLSSKLTTRLRLEANGDGTLEDHALTPYVKDAYIRAVLGKQRLFLGISPSATFNWLEGFWGLRHVEKTPVDLFRLDSSRDFGVSLEGPIPVKGLYYVAQFGNNAGQNSETDKYKAFRFEGRFEMNPVIAIEVLVGAFPQPGGKDQRIYQVFGGYQGKLFRGGLQYVHKDIDSGTSAPTTNVDVTSAFGVFDFIPKKGTAYLRIDWASGNNKMTTDTGVPGVDGIDYLPIDNQHDFAFYLLGMEWYLHKNFRSARTWKW